MKISKEIPRFDSIRSYMLEETGEIRFVLKQHPRDILKVDLQKDEVYIDSIKYDIVKIYKNEYFGSFRTEIHIIATPSNIPNRKTDDRKE